MVAFWWTELLWKQKFIILTRGFCWRNETNESARSYQYSFLKRTVNRDNAKQIQVGVFSWLIERTILIISKREMFGDQTALNIVWWPNISPFGHLVLCCLIVFDRVWSCLVVFEKGHQTFDEIGEIKTEETPSSKGEISCSGKNHLNLLSIVSVYISFEKRILATSRGFIRLIASTKSSGKNNNFFAFIIVLSIKMLPLRFSAFLFLVIFNFY